jgi:hypothetical protein
MADPAEVHRSQLGVVEDRCGVALGDHLAALHHDPEPGIAPMPAASSRGASTSSAGPIATISPSGRR